MNAYRRFLRADRGSRNRLRKCRKRGCIHLLRSRCSLARAAVLIASWFARANVFDVSTRENSLDHDSKRESRSRSKITLSEISAIFLLDEIHFSRSVSRELSTITFVVNASFFFFYRDTRNVFNALNSMFEWHFSKNIDVDFLWNFRTCISRWRPTLREQRMVCSCFKNYFAINPSGNNCRDKSKNRRWKERSEIGSLKIVLTIL